MLARLPGVRAKDLIRALEKAGFETMRQKGSHITLHSYDADKTVVVPMHSGEFPRWLLKKNHQGCRALGGRTSQLSLRGKRWAKIILFGEAGNGILFGADIRFALRAGHADQGRRRRPGGVALTERGREAR
jgi:predicted RNA binding protein YcfA (HicA-like mRNA interferase family)